MRLRLVAARTGATWVRLGMQTFFRQPLALAGLFFMFMALMTIATVVPLIGLPLAMTLLPTVTLGLMAATREASQGRFPMPLVLLSGFRAGRQKTRALLTMGLLYATGFLCAMGGSYLVDGGAFARMYLSGQAPTGEMLGSGAFQAAMWVFIALHLPLSLLFWHAPALVYWQDLPVLKSMFFSIVACLRNLLAMVVFALSWMAVMVLAVLGVTALASLLDAPDLASAALMPVLMLVAAMFFTSLYFSYRDSFEMPPPASDAQT